MSVTVYKVILFIALFAVLYQEIRADCYGNYECSGTDVCCKPNNLNSHCGTDCIGETCVVHSDCGGYSEFCCNKKCQEGICDFTGFPGWVIAIIVLSVLGGVGTIVGVVLCFYCAYRRSRLPGVILTTVPVTQPTTVVAGSSQVNYPQGQVDPAAGQPKSDYGPPPAYYPQPQPQK